MLVSLVGCMVRVVVRHSTVQHPDVMHGTIHNLLSWVRQVTTLEFVKWAKSARLANSRNTKCVSSRPPYSCQQDHVVEVPHM